MLFAIRPVLAMKKVLLIAVVCSWLGSTIAAAPPCANVQTGAVTPKIPLPSLPTTAFKSVVRAEFVNNNVTVEATEYVDESVNAATVVVTQNGQTSRVIMSYQTNEVFYVVPDRSSDTITPGPLTCFAGNLSADDNTQLFGMSSDNSGGKPHLYSTSKILNFINGSEVYKGRTTVGGVPANKWSSCVYWSKMNANFTLDYYFTVPGWQTPSGLDQIPLRAEIQGQKTNASGTTYFHHIYQYVNFEPYVNDPETIFTTPPGVYCYLRKAVRNLPTLSNHFYYREEVSDPGVSDGGIPTLVETDIWYDYDLKLVRFDTRAPLFTVQKDFSLSNGPFRTIHDYGLGVQYTIATDINECSIDPIPVKAKGFDAVYNITRQSLGMRSPMLFFNLDNTSYLYAGQRKARGQNCDVFQAVLTNIPGRGTIVYEVYFLTANTWAVPDRGSADSSTVDAVPVRILMWETGHLVDQYEIHDFDQYSAAANRFDVTPCFPGRSSIDFEIAFSTKDTTQMPKLAPYVMEMVQLQIFLSVAVSPVRVQRTRLHWNRINVFFEATLLGVAPTIAKYEVTTGTTSKSGMIKTLRKILSATDCAAECERYTASTCVQFDYCATNQVCALGVATNQAPSLMNNTQCDHYQRVLGGGLDTQTPLNTAWTSLKNRVFSKQFVITLPLPDSKGHVDLKADTTKMDDTQKITLQAFTVRNQVVSTVNRNPTSSNTMTQFQVLPRKVGKGYDTAFRGISVDDCASNCVGEETYNCQSFHYCWDAGTCFMSRLHPDERPNMLKDNNNCDLYIRDYTSNFEKFNGLTVLSNSPAIYQSVVTASQCAKLCTYYDSFHCESFDFCTDISTCFLGKVHYYDAPKANIKQMPSCVHYSRSYIQDFVSRSHKQVPLRDNRVIQDVTPQQCAKLCVQEGSFTCNSFDYCGNFSECRLSDASVANVGQVTLQSSAYCDVYSRQYSSGAAPRVSSSSSSSSSNTYTGGAMAGLAIGMIILGLIMGLACLVVYNKFFTGQSSSDGMAISFSKHENAE